MESGQNPQNQVSASSVSAGAAMTGAPASSAPSSARQPSTLGSNIETPKLTVDVIVDMGAGLVAMVRRKNDPQGWALPGGFVDVGESVESAALREVQEEIGLDVELVKQFHVYSDPKRDARGHTVSVTFIARGWGNPRAGSDAASVELFHEMNLPQDICFDHRQILKDYFGSRY
jgi:8-oxo-dGTP diphosphatase